MSIQLQVGLKIFLQNKENRYLLVKRSSEKYPNIQGHWDIVGGRMHPDSGLMDNLKREVTEETQLTIISNPVLIAAQDIFSHTQEHIVRISYFGKTDGEPILDISENVDYQWLSLEEIKKIEDLDVYVAEIIHKGLLDLM